MYQLVQGQIKSSRDSFLPYALIQQKRKAKGLCIVLPGLRYTVQAPFLHYLTNLSLELELDVLHINYQYWGNDFLSLAKEKQNAIITNDVQLVLDQVLNEFHYSNFYLMAKSLGTIPMSHELITREELKGAKAIWLTPLLNLDIVYENLLRTSQESIILIGDNDHHYNQERLTSLAKKENIKLNIYEQVNHQLDHNNGALNSIKLLKEIVERVKEFILQSQ